mgnify:CR=1 FL=1
MMTMPKSKSGHPCYHGSPYDRGSADRYYGRTYNPHCYICKDLPNEQLITTGNMTVEQVASYTTGFNEETNRKEWL